MINRSFSIVLLMFNALMLRVLANEAIELPLLDSSTKIHTEDLHAMLERREIRVLVAHSRINYEVESGKQKGLIYDALVELEKNLNQDLATLAKKNKTKTTPLRVVILPMSHDKLFPALLAGHGDLIAGDLLVTENRLAQVAFTHPFYDEAREVFVTHQQHPVPDELSALSGRTVYVRASSGHYQSLMNINKELAAIKAQPVDARFADEHLSDDELLEMVNARLIPATITYQFRFNLWSQLFPHIRSNEHFLLSDHGKLAWAVRKNNPQFIEYLNKFVSTHRKGSRWGNIEMKKYFGSTSFARHALDESGRTSVNKLQSIFQRYGTRYDIDHLLLLAQGFQESQLDHSVRSPVGAIGIMQIMPSTGKELKVGDIHNLESNVHAGAKYLHNLREHYFSEPGIDSQNQLFFAFAAYNAGPAKIAKMRKLAMQAKLNPDVWFDNVELVTLTHVGRETVNYVANISKYYVAYRYYVDSLSPPAEKQAPASKTSKH